MWKIKFHGRKFLFIGDKGSDGGIATRKQYDNFEPGYAHLYRDGNIRRFSEVIGTKDDIEWLEEVSE